MKSRQDMFTDFTLIDEYWHRVETHPDSPLTNELFAPVLSDSTTEITSAVPSGRQLYLNIYTRVSLIIIVWDMESGSV